MVGDGVFLFLHSPIAFDAALATQLKSIGTIRHLISPNQFHYAHIGEWSRAFPDAITWASPRVLRRARSEDRRAVQERPWAGRTAGMERRNRSDRDPWRHLWGNCLLHKASKTLILTDTSINIELDKMSQPWRLAAWLTGMYYLRGQIFFGMRLPLLLQRKKSRAAIKRVLAWQPERIILSHGRYFESNATAILQRVFNWAL
jgi:hypothetical protein